MALLMRAMPAVRTVVVAGTGSRRLGIRLGSMGAGSVRSCGGYPLQFVLAPIVFPLQRLEID